MSSTCFLERTRRDALRCSCEGSHIHIESMIEMHESNRRNGSGLWREADGRLVGTRGKERQVKRK